MHLVGRSDLADDETAAYAGPDSPKTAELKVAVAAWAAELTTSEVVEVATAFRIPVAPLGRGSTLLANQQLTARGFFGPDPEQQIEPGTTFRLHDAVEIDVDTSHLVRTEHATASDERFPLRGLRVVDLTAWWAGPSATHFWPQWERMS